MIFNMFFISKYINKYRKSAHIDIKRSRLTNSMHKKVIALDFCKDVVLSWDFLSKCPGYYLPLDRVDT